MERDIGKIVTWRHLLIVASILLIGLGFRQYLLAAALTAATAIVAAAVNAYELRITGLELATFSTVLIGYSFTPLAGAVAGLVLVTLQMVIGGQMGVYALWVIPTYGVIGVLAGTVAMPITQLGVVITIGMHILFLGFTSYLTPEGLSGYLPYAIGNTLLNLALFTAVAPALI